MLTVAAAVFDVGAVVAVSVSKPVVGHRVVVAVFDEERVVVDAVEQILRQTAIHALALIV